MFKKLTITAACGVVSMVMAAGAIAGGDRAQVVRGHTGQGRKIRLLVQPRKVTIQGFSIELRCSGGYTLIDGESNFLPSEVNGDGRFHDTQIGSTDEVLIRGRLRGHGVKGQIRVRDRLGKHRCSSPWVSFAAHASGSG